MNNIKNFTLNELASMCITKEELAETMGLNNIPGLRYDTALPEPWLEKFINQDRPYSLVITTTFWIYPEGDAIGRPVSGCKKVQEAIEHLENGGNHGRI